MTDDEWNVIEGLLKNAWPGQWTDGTGPSYRLLVGDYPAAAVLESLRVLTRRAARFRPSAGEIVSEMHVDAAQPTWDEVYDAIYGSGRLMKVRLPYTGPVEYANRGELEAVRDALILEHARAFHPMITAFVEVVTPARLRTLELEDPQYGELRRRELRERWQEFAVTASERMVRGLPLVTGGRTAGELKRVDPKGLLGGGS